VISQNAASGARLRMTDSPSRRRAPDVGDDEAPKTGTSKNYRSYTGIRRREPFVDLHHNLFYSYRGPNADDADHERQLENNLTKALINTLSLGEVAVWRPFLTDLGLPVAPHARFLLQRRDTCG
jgi:hypothetical protein